jgi:hypothetical protein
MLLDAAGSDDHSATIQIYDQTPDGGPHLISVAILFFVFLKEKIDGPTLINFAQTGCQIQTPS